MRVAHREGGGLRPWRFGLEHKTLHVGELLNPFLYDIKLHLGSLHLCATGELIRASSS